ncbi:MAG: ZIP family metal transporter [Candidatus Binatia bacterium]
MDPIIVGFLASLAAGAATGVGALPSLFLSGTSEKVMDTMLGFAAGVMISASAFSLIVPALALGGLWITVCGIALGCIFLELLDRCIPHLHVVRGREGGASSLRRAWLLILAITIHNFPEGLSVGVSFGLDSLTTDTLLAIAIGLQNLPEGLAVALPLIREGYSRKRAVAYATLSGLVEPIAALLGVVIVSWAAALLPFGLAFAAGAMLYVVFDEMIPESHSRGHHKEATFGGMVGFLIMMVLDHLFI